jgi:pyrimidine 5'-nucleotidase
MAYSTVFFDLDDTLYAKDSGLWPLIGERINQYIHHWLGFPWMQVPKIREELYHQYGTTMRGLKVIYDIDIHEYLAFVHDVPVSDYIQPNPIVRQMIKSIPIQKVIFTNADKAHASRVLAAIDLQDLFDDVIDILTVHPYCKPQKESYEIALRKMGACAEESIFIDDSEKNIDGAKSLGFYTVHVRNGAHSNSGDISINDLVELKDVFEEILFSG